MQNLLHFFVPDLGPTVTVYVPDAIAFAGTVTAISLSVKGNTLPFASLIVKSLAVKATALLSVDAGLAFNCYSTFAKITGNNIIFSFNLSC